MKCGIINPFHLNIVKKKPKRVWLNSDSIIFKSVVLKLRKQCFLYKHFGETFSTEISLINRHCFISNFLKSFIDLELRDTYTNTIAIIWRMPSKDMSLKSSFKYSKKAKKWFYPRKVRIVLQNLEKFLNFIENNFTYTLSNDSGERINNKTKNLK